MSLLRRDSPDPLSPDEVALWVHQAFITTCLNAMLLTLVVYDARTLLLLCLRLTSPKIETDTFLVCTFDKEVRQSPIQSLVL